MLCGAGGGRGRQRRDDGHEDDAGQYFTGTVRIGKNGASVETSSFRVFSFFSNEEEKEEKHNELPFLNVTICPCVLLLLLLLLLLLVVYSN